MADYISREAVKLAIVDAGQSGKRYKIGEFWELNRDEAWAAIDSVPSADVAPVRHGRWVPHPTEREWDVCTACGIGFHRRHYGLNDDGTEWVEEANAPYCLNCGAIMGW